MFEHLFNEETMHELQAEGPESNLVNTWNTYFFIVLFLFMHKYLYISTSHNKLGYETMACALCFFIILNLIFFFALFSRLK